ncbi:hypothetical protein C2G38_2199951 [Gigaspora rosea]|uniref:Uncharacterized protein n=1 Tax=Gigaspora rosea TaxID=44941 RepID=A0A397UYQ3_9GLOM|nr:hypothetical protein C2G38_2199951 [Gigaspora rosea]
MNIYNISADFKFKTIDVVVKILYKNSTSGLELTSKHLKHLSLTDNELDNTIFENFYKNNAITSMNIYNISSDFK